MRSTLRRRWNLSSSSRPCAAPMRRPTDATGRD
jgi:hypothetical protein